MGDITYLAHAKLRHDRIYVSADHIPGVVSEYPERHAVAKALQDLGLPKHEAYSLCDYLAEMTTCGEPMLEEAEATLDVGPYREQSRYYVANAEMVQQWLDLEPEEAGQMTYADLPTDRLHASEDAWLRSGN